LKIVMILMKRDWLTSRYVLWMHMWMINSCWSFNVPSIRYSPSNKWPPLKDLKICILSADWRWKSRRIWRLAVFTFPRIALLRKYLCKRSSIEWLGGNKSCQRYKSSISK
jgi:hypothetical protein